jgi:hypothetical protein
MWTGRIDVKNYGYVSRDECIQKGNAAGCTAKWCDYACEDSCCVTVY